jgi:catechol 2,3-dioxygenase-like lactoylglutathione lyase family enzyme
MRPSERLLFSLRLYHAIVMAAAAAFVAIFAGTAAAQSKTILPYDHIHLNEPGAEASIWYEKNIPGGRRIIESPDRIMYGAVRLMFLPGRSTGGSDGSVIEHLGFSVPDLDAKMRELAAINTKVIEPAKQIPGAYKAALIESPWGTRIQLVQDPDVIGLHHVQLRSPDPEAYYAWLLNAFGGERTKIKGQIDSVKYTGPPGFTTVYILVAKGDSVPSTGRSIDHIGWRSVGPSADTMKMLTGKGIALETPTARDGSPAQASKLHLNGNNTDIYFFYIRGPNGTRIEIVERPGIKAGE